MNTTTTAGPAQWQLSLEDSVYALGAAAREYQRAYGLAVLATEGMEVDRLRLHDGLTETQHPGYRGDGMPHMQAVASIGRRYMDLEHELRRDYELAAGAYAWGAHWAAQEILAGRTPARVRLTRDEDGALVRAFQPDLTVPDSWRDAARFSELRAAMHRAETDTEAAAAAMAYGELVQAWLPAMFRTAAERRLALVAPRP